MFHSDDRPFPSEWPDAGTLVVVSGNVKKSFDGSRSFMLDRMEPLEATREEHIGSILIKMVPEECPSVSSVAEQTLVAKLAEHCQEHPGETPAKFQVAIRTGH